MNGGRFWSIILAFFMQIGGIRPCMSFGIWKGCFATHK
ncbi:hypothetical protein WCP94_002659 [Bilophila wadsworthia]